MSILEVIAPAVAEAERIESGGEVRPNEIAALLRFNAGLVADYASALQEERAHNAAQLSLARRRLESFSFSVA